MRGRGGREEEDGTTLPVCEGKRREREEDGTALPVRGRGGRYHPTYEGKRRERRREEDGTTV